VPELCEMESYSIHTPNIEDCRKWNGDSTQKSKPNKQRNYKDNNDHSMEGNMKACIAQIQNDLKQDLKKKSKSKKSKRRSKKYYDSSDSSDSSDSD